MAVTAQELGKAFGSRSALSKVSFELPQGSFLSVFGPNGAGKTTLLRVLATLARPTSGQAYLAGFEVRKNADEIRENIGFISHQPMLYFDLTAYENLQFSARLYGVRNAEDRIQEMLEAVGLSHRRFDVVRDFSRGMIQRLSIARALIHDPKIVLLDEPYSGLDPHAVDIFDRLIEKMRADRTFIMVSHDLAKGFAMCSHALILSRGKVVLFDEKSNIDEAIFTSEYQKTVGMGVA